MALNFNDVLTTKMTEIERPPLIPMGHYIGQVTKVPNLETVGKGKEWDTCDFPIQLMQAQDDVDQAALAEYGGLGKHSTVQRRFMFNKNDEANFKRSLFQMKRFLADHLKIEGADGDTMQLKEALNASFGKQVVVFIKHRQDKEDKELFYAEISQTAPVE